MLRKFLCDYILFIVDIFPLTWYVFSLKFKNKAMGPNYVYTKHRNMMNDTKKSLSKEQSKYLSIYQAYCVAYFLQEKGYVCIIMLRGNKMSSHINRLTFVLRLFSFFSSYYIASFSLFTVHFVLYFSFLYFLLSCLIKIALTTPQY